MMVIASVPAESMIVAHPLVTDSEVAVTAEGVVVAVILRPTYGRSERRKVLAEVAQSVRNFLAANESGEGVGETPVYVCADVDVYQAILHGAPLDVAQIASRTGCYVLQ